MRGLKPTPPTPQTKTCLWGPRGPLRPVSHPFAKYAKGWGNGLCDLDAASPRGLFFKIRVSGFVRGLKPPPPSAMRFSARLKPCPCYKADF